MPSFKEMARLLKTSPVRISQLIESGYLRRIGEKEIELPPHSVLQWLKLMLLPLPSRPLFTLSEIERMSGLGKVTLKKVILAWKIPLYYDPMFGELMSPSSLITLINALHSLKEPVRFDRIVLLNWMQGMGRTRYITPKLPYSKMVEKEIKRIAQLAEPERTISSQAFYQAYRDARILSDAINWRKRVPRSVDKWIPWDQKKDLTRWRRVEEKRRKRKREEELMKKLQCQIRKQIESQAPPLQPSSPPLPLHAQSSELNPQRSPDNEPNEELQ